LISGFSWSAEAISGFPEEEDVSVANPLAELLSDPRVELAFMLRGQFYDTDLGAERDVCVSSHGYATLDDGGSAAEGIPDHTPFPNALVSAFNVKVDLISSGAWISSAVPGYGAAILANPNGEFDYVQKLNCEMRSVMVWIGRRQWIGPSFRKLGKVFTGTVETVTWNTSQISFNIRDLTELFNQDVNPEAYLGFGTAVRFRADADRVTIPYGTWTRPVDVDGNPILSVEFMVAVRTIRDSVLCTQGGSAGWVARLHVDGSVGLYDRDLTNWVRTDPGLVAVDVPTRLGFYGDPEGLKIRVNGKTVASNAVPYAGPVVVADVLLGGP
jgi:hypothetical protein